jgi:RNA polymerase sigma-70 factor (ECF subfamily)
MEDLFQKYASRIYRLAFRYLGDANSAEDAVQETFLRALRKGETFQHRSRWGTWLYRIAINVCLDQIRAQKRTDYKQLQSATHVRIDQPHKEMAREELAVEVRQVVKNLRPELRMLIILRDWEDLSYEEISKITRLSIGTISSRLNRARRLIYHQLQENRRSRR